MATATPSLAQSRILVQGKHRYPCWHAGKQRSNTPMVTLRVFDNILRDIVGEGAYFVKRQDHILVFDPTLPSALWPRTMALSWAKLGDKWQQLVSIPPADVKVQMQLAKN